MDPSRANLRALLAQSRLRVLNGLDDGRSFEISMVCELGQRAEYAGKRIVVILPSFAERYLSTALFEGLD